MKTLLTVAVGSALSVSTFAICTPSHAAIQTVSGGSITLTGSTINNSPIVFPPFTAQTLPNLIGTRVVLKNTKFAGLYTLTGVQTPTFPPTTYNVSVSAIPKFSFTNPSYAPSGSSSALTPDPFPASCPNLGTFACQYNVPLNPANQPYVGTFSQLSANNYWTTGNPTITASQILFSKIQAPAANPPTVPDMALSDGQLTFMADIFLEYEYVPGPLPLLGAGAAFGWSRRLRKRIATRA
jgi:hypothetical protein